jgi:hypothetical protein
MIEVGNAPDFSCGADADSLARCQAHMTMWAVMKSPLILGNDIPNMDAATLGVLANAEAIAVSQDAWGVQARRVDVQAPTNKTLTASTFDNIAVIAPCDAAEPTQLWQFINSSSGAADGLYLQPCDASNVFQQWAAVGPTLRNVGAGACIDSSGRQDPGQVLACDASKASQHWALQLPSGHVSNGGACLDVFNFAGPDVYIGSCKVPGNQDSNQVFVSIAGGLLRSNDTGAPANSCLAVAAGPPGGVLKTTDGAGNAWCLANRNGAEGTWGGGPCAASHGNTFTPSTHGDPSGPAVYDLAGAGGSPSWNNQDGASGPLPSTRYIQGYGWSGSSYSWVMDLAAPGGTSVRADDNTTILNDNLVGGVTRGGDYCLQLSTGGLLEVWVGPLSLGRFAVALFNRSPGPDSITLHWRDLNQTSGTAFTVRDIWAEADLGSFSTDFARPVAAHAAAFLVLTPA